MTKDKILNVALDMFGQFGYEDTALSDIAKTVGIKKPSIYNHFNSKEDIFREVLDEVIRRERAFFSEELKIASDLTCEEQLRELFEQYNERMATSEVGLFWKRVTFFPPECFAEVIKEKFKEVEGTFTEILKDVFHKGKEEAVIRDLPFETLTASFYTVIDGLFLERHFYGEDEYLLRKEASWKVFWLGIQHPEI
ncbi:TetR/AcrR family transcriptional regulator [Thalassobacillus hwangdonensis]|uniref:TetR/AcrR family transcriptional regulator n=1 Tax=Thalassobacillus hwangdonensis TaxID=546108 RepID=A0ABW3L7X9_9BACI